MNKVRYAIYCPLMLRDDSPSMAIAAVDWFTAKFGGCTVVEGEGYWRDDSGEIIHEPVKYVWAWGEASFAEFHKFACELAEHYKQHAVAYEIGETFMLINLTLGW